MLRYALDHIELRENGQVIGTDGHQLLVQRGFDFPWKGDAIIPASKLFACKELPRDLPVSVAKVEKTFAFRLGPGPSCGESPRVGFPASMISSRRRT